MPSDIERAAEEVAAKLRSRNIRVMPADSPETLVLMLEAVEEFEQAVTSAGGDLMVDEPPNGAPPQPDDPRFLLPERESTESGGSYIDRLTRATSALRRR